nr:hypothetical transcript [Hymenolepis microstoma]CUU99479.1 hypothetical transcript [Hymenolepis microstoma]
MNDFIGQVSVNWCAPRIDSYHPPSGGECNSQEVQLSRLLKRNPDLTYEAAISRIEAQLPLATKVARATIVIDNERDDGYASLNEQVETCLLKFRKKAQNRFKCAIGICACFVAVFFTLIIYIFF